MKMTKGIDLTINEIFILEKCIQMYIENRAEFLSIKENSSFIFKSIDFTKSEISTSENLLKKIKEMI